MAKFTTGNTSIESSSDATVRAWIDEFHDMLVQSGLTQTADTGQHASPSDATYATNSLYGYEIWRFNDSLQATAPVFLRFEFRQGASINRPLIHLYIGSGTDGEGNLTNSQLLNSTVLTSAGQTTSHVSYICYSGDALGIHWKGPATYSLLYAIERTHDSDGTPNGAGLISFHRAAAATYRRALSIKFPEWTAVSSNTPSTQPLYCMPQGVVSGLNMPANELQLMFARVPGQPPSAFYRFLAAHNSLVNTGETAEATPYGATPRTYIGAGRSDAFCPTTDSTSQLLMVWED